MYIIELIYKLLTKRKKKKTLVDIEEKEYVKCEHLFLPLDSTKKYLACTKCGLVIKKEDEKNFFKGEM
ncbi:MAG: hypothetical protein MRZ90_03690 [Candidatus Gastranaerophilales bacterium]|nr:hypothetical protein [Candidatus Gastranaerophilales bacterium]